MADVPRAGSRWLAPLGWLAYSQGMLFRAIVLLTLVVALSVAATFYFGNEVLIAVGLIAVQLKIIFKSAMGLKLPVFVLWLKTHSAAFFKIELIKKWIMSTLMPMVLGKAVLRRLAGLFSGYIEAVQERYARMIAWYQSLSGIEKLISGLILIFAALALSVSTVGLWLILFSVQLPLWIVAGAAAFGRMAWVSLQKMVFKAVAFLQLGLLWKGLQKLLPERVLKRKRAFDYRVARAVIRRRRMTVRQLADRKESLPFRMGLMVDYLFGTGKSDQG
ncbi:MAG: hypothetical protein ACRBB0_20765 [Pelagimonas sp.]|uniref:hypothetical protein n=1 Tax=Pelagimonas sp. TaxID=2073170 RepID=UPI003D6C2D9F